MAEQSSWMNSAATDFEGFSRWMTKLFRAGVATGWTVGPRGTGANMSVDVAPGDGVPMTTNTAPWSWSTAIKNVAIQAASANNRRDLIVAYVDLSVTNPSTSTPNNPGALKFLAVKGTAATSPTDPTDSDIRATAVGASNPYQILARVSLTSSTTQITSGQITSLITPIALNIQRLWGGSSNTLGHQLVNAADAYLALTSRSDGKIGFAELLSTIFSGQIQTQTNAGTAGGTMNYVNIGGIKLLWCVTGSLANTSTTPTAYTFTFPTGFFSATPTAIPSPANVVALANQFANLAGISSSAASVYLCGGGPSGAAAISLIVVGT